MTGSIGLLVPSAPELRAAALALRQRLAVTDPGPAGVGPTAPGDAGLVAELDEPFSSVEDVHDRLAAATARLRERSDRRSVFLTVYTAMTGRVAGGIDAGTFEDPAWVRDYLVAFAEHYRRALLAFERGEPARVPLPWQIAFRASTGGSTLLVQDALLGISAHVNYDLAYALTDVGIDPDRAAKRRDHDRINDVLRQLVDVVQQSLVEVYGAEGYEHVDAALGSFDEAFTLLGLAQARNLAWENAEVLADSDSALVDRLVRFRVRTVATGAGLFVLAPSADPDVLALLRDVEGGDPPIDGLLDAFEALADDVSAPA